MPGDSRTPDDSEPATHVHPLHAERLHVDRQRRETGTVRVSIATRTRTEPVDLALESHTVSVERVPVGRWIDVSPAVRTEGDTTVVPVVEEVLVRRLMLREEVRITRHVSTRQHTEQVPLRTQEVSVSRTGAAVVPDAAPFAGNPPNFTDPQQPAQGDFHHDQ